VQVYCICVHTMCVSRSSWRNKYATHGQGGGILYACVCTICVKRPRWGDKYATLVGQGAGILYMCAYYMCAEVKVGE